MCLRFSAHCSKFSGLLPNFTGRILSLRGVFKSYGETNKIYGDTQMTLKFSRAVLSLRGILTQTDRHIAAIFPENNVYLDLWTIAMATCERRPFPF